MCEKKMFEECLKKTAEINVRLLKQRYLKFFRLSALKSRQFFVMLTAENQIFE